MSELKSLVDKLNPLCRSALERAAELCVQQTNFNVEVEHLFAAILGLPDSDVHRALGEHGVDLAAVLAELNAVVERLRRGNARTPSLAPQVPHLLERAWLTSSLTLGEPLTRSGGLLCALLDDDGLRGVALESVPSLAAIPRAGALVAQQPRAARVPGPLQRPPAAPGVRRPQEEPHRPLPQPARGDGGSPRALSAGRPGRAGLRRQMEPEGVPDAAILAHAGLLAQRPRSMAGAGGDALQPLRRAHPGAAVRGALAPRGARSAHAHQPPRPQQPPGERRDAGDALLGPVRRLSAPRGPAEAGAVPRLPAGRQRAPPPARADAHLRGHRGGLHGPARAGRGRGPQLHPEARRRAAAGVDELAGQDFASRGQGDRDEGTLRFLALGDSYTIGEGVAEAERWPVQLAAMLADRGIGVDPPEIIARTGWTTDELDAAIDAAAPAGPYSLVSLLVGVNNQYRGRSAEEYREHFRFLLARAIGFAGNEARRVLVLSIPDWGVTPFAAGRDRAAIAREIDAFNAIARDEAAHAGARWVDVTPASRAAGSRMLVDDGLHPSGAAYEEWARLALPHAVEALTA